MNRFNKLLCLLTLLPLFACGVEEAKRLIILANSASGDSVAIARFYAKSRLVPEANIIALAMPEKETISIAEYVEHLHNPLLETLLDRRLIMGAMATETDAYGRKWLVAGLHDISYIVPVYGVPLRVSNDATTIAPNNGKMLDNFRYNRASVDSELALLATPGRRSMTAYTVNPFFNNKQPSEHLLQTALRVSRIDGPDIKAVRSLIERTLEAEKTGLQGRAYFDLGGPHADGNEWFRQASEMARAAYFDTTIEATKRLMDERDRFDAPAIYMGWYKKNAYGNFKIPNWTVPPGALALHLHSFSAYSLRDTNQYWLGALIKMGFCATVGNVYEPYLHLTHHPHRLLELLLEGGNWGEAVVYSIPGFSWMGVAVGDPLYRPFQKKLGTQIANGDVPYAVLREVNRIDADESAATATSYLHAEFRRSASLPLAFVLASRYADSGDSEKAIEVLRFMQYITVYAKEDRVLVQKLADLISSLGKSQEALVIYERLLSEESLAKPLKISLLTKGAVLANKLGRVRLADKWSQECLILRASSSATK